MKKLWKNINGNKSLGWQNGKKWLLVTTNFDQIFVTNMSLYLIKKFAAYSVGSTFHLLYILSTIIAFSSQKAKRLTWNKEMHSIDEKAMKTTMKKTMQTKVKKLKQNYLLVYFYAKLKFVWAQTFKFLSKKNLNFLSICWFGWWK